MLKMISPRIALLIALSTSAALLAGAHFFERVLGMDPCLLCLDQREVHWAAVGAAAFALLAGRLEAKGGIMVAGLGALTIVYLFSTWLSGFHSGVEWGLWDGPAECAAGNPGEAPSAGSLIEALDGPGPAGPPCQIAAWRMLGLSMAGYNALASLGLALIAGVGCLHAAQGWRQARAPQGAVL